MVDKPARPNLRAHHRAPTPFIAAAILGQPDEFRVTILNVSRSGAMFQTVTPIAAGSVVTIHFTLKESKVVSCQARVVWNHKVYGVLNRGGLNFIDIDPETASRIDGYVGKYH